MAVLRPLKEGSVRTYQEKVGLGFVDILASEMDADLDTIYAAWNGGVGTGDINNGAVTAAKLGTDCNGAWKVSGTTITPNDVTKAVAIPGNTTAGASVILGPLTAKMRLQASNAVVGCILAVNRDWNNANAQDDPSKPSWAMTMRADTDQFFVARSPAASTTPTTLLTLDGTGNLATGVTTIEPTGTVRIKDPPGTLKVHMGVYNGSTLAIGANDWRAPEVAAWPSWFAVFDANSAADNVKIYRRAGGAAAGSSSAMLTLDAGGNFTISGATATKASGTAWANPSDVRIKRNIESYTQGLDAICALEPRTFEYNGKAGSQEGLAGIGLIANEVQPIMPEMVTSQATKLEADDETPVDLLVLDTTPLQLALVNAVKELATRVAALEAPA